MSPGRGKRPWQNLMFSSPDDAFSYLEGFTNFERRNTRLREYRLDRMKLLLDAFDNPQFSLKCFHVAGSKGKGTTAAFIASVLREQGYKTGLYTSPHVLDYRERITLAGTFFDEPVYIQYISEIRHYLESSFNNDLPGDDDPTTFELLTLLAFLIFRETHCEYAVLETGLGGRLDATNLCVPLISVITNIELEHCSVLGGTIELIASEKAGIIRESVPVIIAAEDPLAVSVITSRAREMNAPCLLVNSHFRSETTLHSDLSSRIHLQTDTFQHHKPMEIFFDCHFSGAYTALNAAAALFALQSIISDISADTLAAGFSSAVLKGRNEIWEGDGTWIFDVAHTKSSIQSLMASVKQLFPSGGILVFALASDKNPGSMIPIFKDWTRKVFVTRPGFFRQSDPDRVFKCFLDNGFSDVSLIDDPSNIPSVLSDSVLPVLVTGSFYLVSHIQKLLLLSK